MLDQSFSSKSFKRLISFKDFSKFNFGKEDDIINRLNEIVEKLNQSNYNFSTLKKIENGHTIYSASTIEDEFALRKLNDNLKRLYKFKQSDRFLIIEQIKTLLLEEVPMSIVKLDIKKFYESIDKSRIIKKIIDDPLLSFESKQIFKKFFLLPEISCIDGLPRGINISASLSEIFMRDFDKIVSQQSGVYYYARYVDDIIIFTFQDPNKIVENVGIILNTETGLLLNRRKTKIIQRQCRCKLICNCNGNCSCIKHCKCKYDNKMNLFFEYLGYCFTFPDIPKCSDKLVITLSKNKINKIKTRIILSFLDFIKTNDFELLERRIAFLTSNFIIKRNKNYETLNAGIYFNSPHINSSGFIELNNLNLFLRKTINSKNQSFGLKLVHCLTPLNRKTLSKYSFTAGFINRKLKKYTAVEISSIKKCWIYG